jgi:primosomal protein N' (replication factor Y)
MLFPDAKVARLDLDTTRKKHGHEEIIFDFQNAKIDILIGTQMVTKGLDFDHVSVVGIINADQLFSFPDFRAAERAFQLLAQVGGRAGRKDKPGKVLIQSNQIDHPVLQHIQAYNFDGFYFEELLTRKQYHYPPFVNLIQLTIKHKKPDELRLASSFLADELRSKLGRQVLGPTTPLVSKVRNMYLRQVLIKVEKNAQAMVHTKAILQEVISETQRQFRSAFIAVEVDA